MRTYRGWAAAIACVALLGSLALSTGASGSDPARDRSCGWILEPTADRENILYPEITTRYLGAIVPVPPGGYVEIRGKFPHSRYMSLQTYSTTLQSMSVLHDEQIRPDPGSTNPFRKGANRRARKRGYTIRIVSGPEPPAAQRPANTLYDQSADGSKSGRGLAYRIYLPDRKALPFGAVPAPSLSFVTSNGTRLDLPTCPDLLPDLGLIGLMAGAGIGNLPIPGPGVLAHKAPVWHKYVNAPTSYAGALLDNDVIDQSLADQVSALTALLPSGLGENADNKYVYSFLSREFGSVAVLRAKLPTTPKTYEGEPKMGARQLRFWSMCTGIRTTQTPGCLVDKDIRPDKHGYFTIAISTAADRPANATSRCGVGWLPWGPDLQGIALMRNMLPASSFHHAVQNAVPGTERKTLGVYYPKGTYFATPAAFNRSGFVAKRCR